CSLPRPALHSFPTRRSSDLRLVSIALPRIRDFRGLDPESFDGRGNYSLGIREQIIFPEIDYDSIQQVRGLDVAITTTAETDDERSEEHTSELQSRFDLVCRL